MMDSYFISTDESLLNKEIICSLLNDCFWSKNIPIEYVERFIRHSLCFGVYRVGDNSLIGFGRVISDYTTYAYVCDIVIDENYRRKGLGKALVKEMLSHSELQGLKAWSLRTSEQGRKIYENYGFKLAGNPETILEISDLEMYSRPSFVNFYKNEEQ